MRNLFWFGARPGSAEDLVIRAGSWLAVLVHLWDARDGTPLSAECKRPTGYHFLCPCPLLVHLVLFWGHILDTQELRPASLPQELGRCAILCHARGRRP